MKKLYFFKSSIVMLLLCLALPGFVKAASPPKLTSPASGATNLSISFTISISKVTGATGYDIEISKNGLFTDSYPDYQGQINGGRSFAVSNLSYATTYTIRWKSSNSTYATTTITTKNPPYSAPALTSPAVGATNLEKSFTIAIAAVTGATKYDIEISKNGLFTDSYPDYQGQLNGGRSFAVSNLTYGQSYTIRWRSNNSSYGSTVVTIKTLSPPTLLSPTAGATDLERSFNIAIASVTDATGYDIELSKSGLFNESYPDYQGQLNAGRSFTVTNLTYGQSYSIRWKANNSTYGSTVVTVKTIAPPVLVIPTAGETDLNTSFNIGISKVTGATNYDIELSLNGLFTDTYPDYQASIAGGRSFNVANLKYGKTYTLRWKADITQYSYATVSTIAAPASYLSNVTNNQYLNVSSMYFYPFQRAGAVSYEWQFDTTSSFNSSALITKTTTASSDYGRYLYKSSDFISGAKYYSRIRVYYASTDVSSYTDPADMVSFYSSLSLAEVEAPYNGQVMNRISMKLECFVVKNATNYELHLSTDSTFTTYTTYIPNRDFYSIGGWDPVGEVIIKAYDNVKNLSWNTNYYLRAYAYNANQSSAPGSFIRFSTGTPQIVVTNPQQGQTGLDTSFIVTMNKFNLATIEQYVAEFSTTSDFANSVSFISSTRSIPVKGFAYNTQYYLRTQVKIAGVWYISSSATIGFTTKAKAAKIGLFSDESDSGLISGVSLYPNPFNENTSLIMDGAKSYTVMITDMHGVAEKIYEGKGIENFMFGNNLPKGMYMITIIDSDGKKESLKIVKN